MLRHEHNITQAQLANELGIGTSTIGMYESGIRKPSYNVLKKIANYFNVSVDYLVKDSNCENDLKIGFPVEHFNKLSASEKKQIQDLVDFLYKKYHK